MTYPRSGTSWVKYCIERLSNFKVKSLWYYENHNVDMCDNVFLKEHCHSKTFYDVFNPEVGLKKSL